ncbi:hypothetical protein [Maribacter sp. 2210JD10-5]|uniref:hypothetical protein n=1 Tax=Maribacter sp. 2210JD10-5 TaxID=3386272 RepID=UPI0039BD2E78
MNIRRNLKLSVASLCLVTSMAMAQEKDTEALKTTTTKTYMIHKGDEVEKRTVEISTVRNNDIKLDENDSTKINQDRIVQSKSMITKTVKIDKDKDDAFDEKIVFSYKSATPEDFVLVSNDNELMVAIDNGENLKILENMSLKSKNSLGNNQAYIFTDNNGKEIEFMVEEYDNSWNNMNDSK